MNITRRSLLSTLPLFSAAGFLRAQQQGAQQGAAGQGAASQTGANPAAAPAEVAAPQAAFKTDVKLVNVYVTVRDKKGAIVTNLSQSDFAISEDDHPQVIKYFSRENNLPLSLGLMVDTSGSQRNVLDSERTASEQFLRQVMRPEKDLAFVIHFDSQIELLQDLTADKVKLQKAIELCQPSDRPQFQQQGGQGGNYPSGGGYPNGGGYPQGGGGRRGGMAGTTLYDAIYLACDEVVKKQQGRKALILLTDGVDHGSKYTLSMAIESAQRADTMVYSVLFSDPHGYGNNQGYGPPMGRRRIGMGYPGGGYPGGGYPGGGYPGGGYPTGGNGGGANGKKVLQQIADETGGRFFEVSKKLPLDRIYDDIEEELRSQYSIGYTSDTPPDAGRLYRKIAVAVPKQKTYVVRAREGYYAT